MADQSPRLFLIDGSAYIFRAFFTIPPLKNSTGLPTIGFTNLLLKFLKQHKQNVAFLSRDLATVKRDGPVNVELEQLKRTGFDIEKVRTLFTELEFANLIKVYRERRLRLFARRKLGA